MIEAGAYAELAITDDDESAIYSDAKSFSAFNAR